MGLGSASFVVGGLWAEGLLCAVETRLASRVSGFLVQWILDPLTWSWESPVELMGQPGWHPAAGGSSGCAAEGPDGGAGLLLRCLPSSTQAHMDPHTTPHT